MKLLKWLLIVCAAGMVVGGGYVCVKGYSLLEQALSSESLEDKIDELRRNCRIPICRRLWLSRITGFTLIMESTGDPFCGPAGII